MPGYKREARQVVGYISRLQTAGAHLSAAKADAAKEPPADAGMFAPSLPAWEPDRDYPKDTMLSYEGAALCTRQAVRSLAVYPPFSAGTEALYGARPCPDRAGVYPYVYNMYVCMDMLVREESAVYRCYNAPELDEGGMYFTYPPSQLAAHFEVYSVG